MPVVGKDVLRHKTSGTSAEIRIKFTNKSKLFEIDGMPEEILDWHGGDIVAKDYDTVLSAARKVYDAYYDSDMSETKWIGYMVKIDDFGSFSKIDTGVGISWQIFYRFEIGGKKFISKGTLEQCIQPKSGVRIGGYRMQEDSDTYGNPSNGFTLVPYTEEVEVFFKDVEARLKQLGEGIKLFFGDSAESLLENLNSQKLLP